MTDPLQAILQPDLSLTQHFSPSSRYFGIATSTLQVGPDNTVVYLQRRFIPPPDQLETLQEHSVSDGERLDNITATYLGDPLLFWRLCDANNAMQPDELTQTIGRRLRITLPQSINGPVS